MHEKRAYVGGNEPRYHSVEKHHIIDFNTGESASTLPRLKPNLQLIAGKTLPAHFIGFPIVQISKKDGQFIQDVFCPSCLMITPDTDIGKALEQLIIQIRQKTAFLSEQCREHGASKETVETVKSLTSGLILVDTLYKIGQSHPWTLYQALTQLAGHVWNIDPMSAFPSFQPYDHQHIHRSFMEVIIFIRCVVDRIQEGYKVRSLTKKGRQFTLFLEKEWTKNTAVILGVRTSHRMKMSQLVDWIMQAVIASQDSIEHARKKRILGAERKIVDKASQMKLYPPRGMTLVQVSLDPIHIRAEEDLVIFNVEDIEENRPIEIVLYTPKIDEAH